MGVIKMQLNWTNLTELTKTGVSNIKEIAGIYRLSYHNPNDQKYYVYYVGQAQNLKTRLSEHLIENETNKCCNQYLNKYNCYFRAAAISKQTDRDGVEVTLYNHFGPSCPERIPDIEPLDINFE